jgi:cytochrome c oxidase subunit II
MKRILLPLFVALCVASVAHAQPVGSGGTVPPPPVMGANPGAASDTAKPSPIGSTSDKSPGAAPAAAQGSAAPATPAGPAWYDELAARPKDISTNFWLPKSVNKEGKNADQMFVAVLALSIFFWVAIWVAVIYFVWKYRGRSMKRVILPSAAHNDALEITWTVIPTIICVFLFYFGWRAYIKVVTPPNKAVEINVLAWRWAWEFKHENGVTDNNLHVPVNRPVRLVMTSKDVLHSFFIPVMRVKQDLVPRRYTYAWFEAEIPGTYQMYCAEYCGTNHSQMKPAVVVHSAGMTATWDDAKGHHSVVDKGYENYLNDKAAESTNLPPVELGKRLYEKKGCNACHTVDGSARVGPSWKQPDWGKPITMSDGKTITMDENYVRESILSPLAKARPGYPPSMPSFEGQLKEKELAGLIAYIKSLKQ